MAVSENDVLQRLQIRLNGTKNNQRELPDMGTRHIGGSKRRNHPYISGYFHAMWDVPEAIFKDTKEHAQKWLAGTCESFNPPQTNVGGLIENIIW